MSETDSQCVAWGAARVNGPRPPAYDGPCCAAMGPWTFGCTRAKDHSGQHVATAGDEVAAVWAGQHGWRPATTAADAYAHAANLVRAAVLKYTLSGNQGPEWVRREVVLDLAERLAALAKETT